MSSKFALTSHLIPYPPEALPKKSSKLSQTFWLPHSLATYRNTPQNTSAASSCTSQATTAPRAAPRRAHKKKQKHIEQHGLLLVPPERRYPGPRADRAVRLHREERRHVQGRRLLRLPWRPVHKSNCRGASESWTSTPSTRRQLDGVALRDASSMAWHCGLLLPSNEHPTHFLICAQAATRRTRTRSG